MQPELTALLSRKPGWVARPGTPPAVLRVLMPEEPTVLAVLAVLPSSPKLSRNLVTMGATVLSASRRNGTDNNRARQRVCVSADTWATACRGLGPQGEA